MKHIILIIAIFLVSCNPEDKEIKNNTSKSEYPKKDTIYTHFDENFGDYIFYIFPASNGHEYAYYGNRMNFEHYIECKYCKKDTLWK